MDRSWQDADLLPALALLWLVSVARVGMALVRGEAFGAEATLALAAVVCVPFVLLLQPPRHRA